MKKAIVTGANGFIGTALCKALAENGVSIIAIVRNKEKNILKIKNIPQTKIIYCDMADFRNLAHYVNDRDVDVFYHLAWVGSAGILRGDCDVQLKNVQYTCDAVKACSEIKCKRFVFASSIMEYEIEAIMASDKIPELNTLYSSAKVAADYMARTVAGSRCIDYIRAVISNVYGPGETSARLINTSLRKMLNGEHCAFSTGEQIYDFIYIDDAVRTFIEIAKKGVANRTYYIGSQHPKPLKEFLCEMRDIVDSTLEIGLGEMPFNGISLTYNEFDINAVKNDTGFVPEVSFSDGIKNTMKWMKDVG